MTITIKEGNLDDAIKVDALIPEFENHYNKESYSKRLDKSKHLILVAFIENKLAGYKIGSDRFEDGSFYTWVGGVVPEFRKMKVAKALAEYQENWARNQGFSSIILKTRNRYKNMLLFAIKNGFQIIDFKLDEKPLDNRIILRKKL
ncbi:GNAT family N-acetyltransferase [Candidatus Woesearchaeota archaeon]|nr:GNAT family N-acetyltransferase [Candidatus Woesearchaeota archaeon]